ncbi:MAG: hypothetical protein R3F19_29680 [Verrucomicrobiales bacterium]
MHAQVDSAFLAEFSQQPEETDGTGNLIQIWLNDKATDAELKTVGGETHLVRLYINGDNVTNDGIAALIDLTELKTLRIESPNLTDAGLRHLKSMKKLSSLLLGHTGIISGQR